MIRNKVEMQLKAAGINTPINLIQNISTGLLNEVFLVKLVDNQNIIIRNRVFQHDEYGQLFAAEQFVYDLIKGKMVNVPRLYSAFQTHPESDSPFAVFQFIAGKTVDLFFGNAMGNAAVQYKILNQLAFSLSEIHSVPGPGYGTMTSIDFNKSQTEDFLWTLFSKEIYKLEKIDLSLMKDYQVVLGKWIKMILSLPQKMLSPCVVHGDIHGRNLIVDNHQELFLIDWEASRYRMPLFDFGQLKFLNLKNDENLWKYFIESYLNYFQVGISFKDFAEILEIIETFWKCRMALFQLSYPQFQNDYFGNGKSHLEAVKYAI